MQVKPGCDTFGLPKPSPSASAYQVVATSTVPQPHTPGAILFGSLGQPSLALHVPSPSVSSNVPAQVHPALHTSLIVQALLSLHAVPGIAVPPNTPWQSIGRKFNRRWRRTFV